MKIIILLILSMFLLSCFQQEGYFGDYKCTDDCSGHKAGYEWAKKNNIEDSSDCGGNSQSFAEGCLYYVDTFF